MAQVKGYRSILSTILAEGEVKPFRLAKRVILTGKVLDHYDPQEGKIFKVKFETDFPIVVLEEDTEYGPNVWMSDSPLEQEALAQAVKASYGRVLTSGLGIGLFPFLASRKSKVKKIDIIERSSEVIELVGKQLQCLPKLEIIHADLYDFLATTRRRYDFIYLDIWPDHIGPIKDVDRATKAAQRCLRRYGQVRVWLQELIDRVKDALPKEAIWPTQESGFHDPCLICGKTLRNDFAGLCMDCADLLGVSDLFMKREG